MNKNTSQQTRKKSSPALRDFPPAPPHLITDLHSLKAVGDHIFSVDGTEFEVSERVTEKFDKLIQLKAPELVKITSGDEGLCNARNYFATATAMSNPQKILLVADPTQKQVVNMKALKGDYIPSESFFDFLDFFAERKGYQLDSLSMDSGLIGGGTAYLSPEKPSYTKVMNGEEFMSNGIFFHWSLDSMEVGHYFVRLICSNGAIEQVKSSQLKVNSLSADSISSLMHAISDEKLMAQGFANYAKKPEERIGITASLRELGLAKHHLDSLGVPPSASPV